MRLTLIHLYGDLMSLYGDRGNIIALQRRCAWRQIELEVIDASVGDPVKPAASDLFFFGGGQDREQATVSEDLARGNGEAIEEAVREGAALLAVCGGYQLLGRFFRTGEGAEIPGSSLFDAFTVAGPERNVGNVVAETEIDGTRRTLVGFENHSGRTYLGPEAQPLARVLVGRGNNGEDKLEGCRQGTAIGTYLHGPILPKNPWLADWLIAAAVRRRTGAEMPLPQVDDTAETIAHDTMAKRILEQGNARTSIR